MSDRPMLEGEIMQPDEQEDLRERIAELQSERDAALRELATLKRSMASIRRQLQPWHTALRGLFGELDQFGDDSSAAVPSGSASKWEFLGRKIGGKAPAIIEMLLVQKEMTVTQLSRAVRCSYETARYTVRKMRETGIVVTNGSIVSLKG